MFYLEFEMKRDYKILVAYDKNRGIGKDLEIPWYIPEDLKRFRELTRGQTVIMGAKTFKSIIDRNGKPLPKRKNIILSRTMKDTGFEDCVVYNHFEELLAVIDNAWIIGGADIYSLFMPYVTEIYATEIDNIHECNIFFPELKEEEWDKEVTEEKDGFSYILFRRKA